MNQVELREDILREKNVRQADNVMWLAKNGRSNKTFETAKNETHRIRQVQKLQPAHLMEQVMDMLANEKDLDVVEELKGIKLMIRTCNLKDLKYAEEMLNAINNKEKYECSKIEIQSIHDDIRQENMIEPVYLMEKAMNKLANTKDVFVIEKIEEAKLLIKTYTELNLRYAREILETV